MSLGPKPNDEPEKPKSLWEKVITLTPVVMTVVATLLAGLSSSEMNQAQYYRSVASQNQSKAGDQWAFFQAKRVRGTQLELEVDRLPLTFPSGKREPALLQASARRLTVALEDAQKKAQELQAPERPEVQAFLPRGEMSPNIPAECQKRLEEALRNEAVSAYLTTRALPEIKDPTEGKPIATAALNDPQLQKAVKAVSAREPAREVADLVRPLKEQTIQSAIEDAETRSLATEEAGVPLDDGLKKIAGPVNDLLSLAAVCHFAAVDLEASQGTADDSSKVLGTFLQSEARVKSAAEELNNLLQAIRHEYTARRYKREGDNNLQTAVLYEVQVRKSNVQSEGHRQRSQLFFLGMLGAQAGVSIASIALAARQKSLLWSLAAVAGLTAIGFSAWVYFSM
jgi:hypothetical protein